MHLKIETTDKKQLILIASKKPNKIIQKLKEELKKYQAEIYLSPILPKNVEVFNYCFLINEDFAKITNFLKQNLQKKVTLIFVNQNEKAKETLKYLRESDFKNAKIINISDEDIIQDNVDKILWFSFSSKGETYLNLTTYKVKIKNKKRSIPTINISFSINKKKLFFILITFIFLAHLAFIPSLILSSIWLYRSGNNIKRYEFEDSKKNLISGVNFLNITQKIYSFPRPVYLFLSLALLPDNIIEINSKTASLIDQTLTTYKNTNEITNLILKKDKSDEELHFLKLRLDKLKSEVDVLLENSTSLNQKIPQDFKQLAPIKKQLTDAVEILFKAKKIIPRLNYLLADNTQRQYLILFGNNMELRPGGGFIGSFGILTIKNYTFEDINVYDVYDADGQLKAHIEPPAPIKQYLKQPHWFLRDSNFSPDFLENYANAKSFLEKEIQLPPFSGAIFITTSAIQYLLEPFGNIYLSDYHENINSDNFYLKTQTYAEKNFFPGSIQKKNFLSSIVKHLLINLENTSPMAVLTQVKKALDEKQIAVFFDDEETQRLFDSFYWSGRKIDPKCTSGSNNCLVDYLFPIDANLGINKANFFINRLIHAKIKISADGEVSSDLSIKFNNDSPNEVFPGGTYKNYFQILLPLNSSLKRITKNGVLVENFDEKNTDVKTIGFYFETKPKTSNEIRIEYKLNNYLQRGKGIYQLIVQKQIGSSNNDFILEVNLPKNIYLLNQNFSPLVKDSRIVYNTNLSTDKIFFLELLKD